jgi:hypothetical protein
MFLEIMRSSVNKYGGILSFNNGRAEFQVVRGTTEGNKAMYF